MKQLFTWLMLSMAVLAQGAQLTLDVDHGTIDGDGAGLQAMNGQKWLAHWDDLQTSFNWQIKVKKSGRLRVAILQAAEAVSAGNTYQVSFNEQILDGTVQDSGSWHEFKRVHLGTVMLKPGTYEVRVKGLSKGERGLMNLQALALSGQLADQIEVQVPVCLERGRYFPKRVTTIRLPTYDRARALLPQPILTADRGWLDLYWRCWELAFDHLRNPTPPFVSPYVDEAFNNNIFQWDTIFMVMFWRYGYRAFPAIHSLDNFYCRQHNDGFICREIWENGDLAGVDHHHKNSPQAINPPLFCWAEIENYRLTGDRSRLAQVYQPLAKYVAWLETGRKHPNTRHQLYWSNGLGSGMDNTPRSGSGWVDMSSQMVIQYKNLAEMALRLNKDAEAADYHRRAEAIAAKINQWMWSETDGLYYDLNDDGQPIKWKTAGCFWPLLAGITSKAQEARLIQHLQDPDSFWRANIFPTLAADQTHYDQSGGYWRGGVWAPTNYAIIRGLALRGYHDFAYRCSEKYLNAMHQVYKETGTVWELYAPDLPRPGSGSGGLHGDHQARPDFVGWTGCGPIAMLIENILGFELNAQSNTVHWHLNRTDLHGIRNLAFGDNTVSIICKGRSNPQAEAHFKVKVEKPIRLKVTKNKITKVFVVKPLGSATFSF